MTSKSTKKPWWIRSVTWLIWAVAIVVFLVLVLALVSQTRPFKNWVRDYIVDSANESINGTLAIEQLDGNFFTNLQLIGVNLEDAADTVVRVASVRVRYDLWALLSQTIKIDSLVIDSPYVFVAELPDSTWNLMHLVMDDTVSVPDEDTTAGEFGYAIELGVFLVRGASADVAAVDSMVPDRVDGVNLALSGRYTAKEYNLLLHSFQLKTHQPDLTVANFALRTVGDTSHVAVENLILETAVNTITASADVNLIDFSNSIAEFRADSLVLSEFGAFLPPHIVVLRPILYLQTNLGNDTLLTDLTVVADEQRIEMSSGVASVTALIDSTVERQIGYAADITIQNLALAGWMDNSEMDMLINGFATAAGSGIEPANLTAQLEGNFDQCAVQGHKISEANFKMEYSKGNLTGGVSANGAFGGFDASGSVEQILTAPTYQMQLELRQLDLSKLTAIDTLPTDINVTMAVNGTGFDPDSARGEAELAIEPSLVKDFAIDEGFAKFDYSPEGVNFDTISVTTSALTLDIGGAFSWNQSSDLKYTFKLIDASKLTDLTNGALLGGNGEVSGRVTGNLDDLSADTRLEFFDLALDETAVSQLSGELKVDYRDSTVSGGIGLTVMGIDAAGTLVDSVFVSGEFDDRSFDGLLALSLADGLNSKIVTSVFMDSSLEILLRDISVGYADVEWNGGSDSTSVSMGDDDSYEISHLAIAAETPGGPLQQLRIDGIVDLHGESNLQAVVDNLDLKPLASLYELDLGGSLSADFGLTGPAVSPEVEGQVTISDGYYQGLSYHELGGEFGYSERKATFDLDFKPTLTETLDISGSFPVAFTLSDTTELESYMDTMFVAIKAERLPLEILKAAGYHVEKADGYISCDLAVSNTMEDPKVSGYIDVRDGSVIVPSFGINYKSIVADLNLQPNKLILDSLVLRDEKGFFNLSGSVDYDTSIVSGNISASRLEAVAKDFFVVKHRDYEIQMNSDVELEGTDTAASYGGTLTINRSRFYLPAFMEMSGQDALDEAALPMLVAATLPDSIPMADSLAQVASGAAAADSVRSAFMNNLRGELKVVIPKNTWIRSPDLRLELAGDIDVVKRGLDFELFGGIRVVRGHYELYGKRFTVKKGELFFQGGLDYLVTLDIEAAYVFRTATREKKTLGLFVGGTSEVPVLKFELDEVEISEGDAMSYILFGRSLDELTQGQRSTVSGGSESGSVAGDAAASLLAGQLSSAIGNRLNLDVIEIKAQGDLQSAAVVIGKYLTPDLFMSYERNFGSASDDDLEPETVTLEYQLTRLIYLQLTEGDPEEAGFDVIFKLSKE